MTTLNIFILNKVIYAFVCRQFQSNIQGKMHDIDVFVHSSSTFYQLTSQRSALSSFKDVRLRAYGSTDGNKPLHTLRLKIDMIFDVKKWRNMQQTYVGRL